MLIRIYFYTIFMLTDINSIFELQFAYRIHANRTPLQKVIDREMTS